MKFNRMEFDSEVSLPIGYAVVDGPSGQRASEIPGQFAPPAKCAGLQYQPWMEL